MLVNAVGHEAMIEAAATIAIFNGLVRVADGTGIQLDDGVLADSADYRDRLGLNAYSGASNSENLDSEHVAEAGRASSVVDLFSSSDSSAPPH